MSGTPIELSWENAAECASRDLSVIDRDRRFVLVNRQFAVFLGLPPEEIIGKFCHELVHHMPICNEGCPFSRMMETRSGETLDYEDPKAGKWFRVAVDPILDENGEIAGALHALTDITILKNAEREAARLLKEQRETAERLTSLLNNVPGAAYRGLRDWSLQFFGAEIERTTGHPPEVFLRGEMDWRRIVHPEDLPDVKERFRRAVAVKEAVVRVTYRILRRDGSERWVEDRRQLFYDEQGRFSHVDGLLLDITDRKRSEEELRKSNDMLRQSQKMEAVGRLAGGVAHDFNNLLTVIGGYSDLLMQRLPPDSPYRRDVEEIRKAGTRASSLTQQLLAFSRKQVIAPRISDLNEVVAGTEKMLRRLIGEDIDLVTVLRPGLWNVRVDTGQIEQVLLNLSVNSRDAMPGVGKLLVETENRSIGAEMTERQGFGSPGPYVVLSVRDTGSGMDEETLSHIFEPFFTTKEQGKGTGLGLATVYGIVKQNDGYITVESRPGEGATFRIFFPRCEERPEESSADAPSVDPRGKGETVLIVEDDKMVRRFLRTTLSSGGYTLFEAVDGEEAIVLLQRHDLPIHLVITDVIMPKMGGSDLNDWLAANRPEVKVLFVSGYVDNELLREQRFERGEVYLQKPFTPEALLRTVRKTLS
jgi:two-component system, cell cycle sensor histidine kinase and response regulator CckA